jgi:drug/metabolite transporter (DMT)-like permease
MSRAAGAPAGRRLARAVPARLALGIAPPTASHCDVPDPAIRHHDPARGYLLAVASAAILSTTAIFIRHLTVTYAIPALVLAFWREAMVAVTLAGVLALLRPRLLHLERRHVRFLAVYGVLLGFFNGLWTLSVALNGAAVSTVLVYSSAAFTALLGRWLLAEPLGWAKLAAVALSLGGCALLSGALDPAAWRGGAAAIATGVLSGLGYAIYSLMGRAAAQRGLDPWTTVLWTFAFAAAFMLAANLASLPPVTGGAQRPADLLWLGNAWTGWAVLLLLAAGPTLGGYGLYTVSLAHLPSSVVNLIASMEPAITAAIAYVVLGERLDAVQLAGSALIVSAVVLLRVREAWRAAPAAVPSVPDDF